MSEYQEFTGKTVEEALRNARESFGVGGLDDLDFEILTSGSRGVLGMGAEPARIVAAPRAALGGVAPRREAAAATPLPPQPQREDRERDDRGRDRDRGRSRDREGGRPARPDDRSGRIPPRDPVVASSGGQGSAADQISPAGQDTAAGPVTPIAQPDAPGAGQGTLSAATAPRAARNGPERGRPARSAAAPRRGDRSGDRGGTELSPRDQQELASARSSTHTEREEIQAAEASPEALAAGKEILERLLTLIGYDALVTIHSGDTSKLDVTGEGEEKEALGALIGRKGERLSALQHLVNLMLSRRMGAWTRVLVDVEDYRGRRERQLQEIAHRAAEHVLQTGAMVQLEPMPALERRWIHLALRAEAGVSTQSIGEEPQRRVVILRRD